MPAAVPLVVSGMQLVADHVGGEEDVEQRFDAALAHLAAAGELVVVDRDAAVLAGVALFVGELAEQRVEADRAQASGAGGAVVDRARSRPSEPGRTAALGDPGSCPRQP